MNFLTMAFMDYVARQQALQRSLQADGLGAMLITHLPNVRYLTGFTGSAGVLVLAGSGGGKPKLTLFTDGRYTLQAREQCTNTKVVTTKGAAITTAGEWISNSKRHCDPTGFESEHMTFATRKALARTVRKVRLKPLSASVERIRAVKEAAEITQVRNAVLLASKVFEAIVPDIKPGVPEVAIAAEIEYLCRRMGAEGMSFDTLVAAGKRSALPHGVASADPLPAKGFVIFDFGVKLGGYCSDMTRTVHVGRPEEWARRMYMAVLEAQLAGIAAVRQGVRPQDVDRAARKVLDKARLGKYFTHSTGHGVGLEIHELPSLRRADAALKNPRGNNSRRRSSSLETLQPGMVVTIEPGVYVPGKGGVRIEDMVVVTKQGCEVLTPNSKELIVI